MAHDQQRLTRAIIQVLDELHRAAVQFRPMATPHDGFSTLKEEVDELWDEVKKSKPMDHPKFDVANVFAMRHEAIQVAAMALRFIVDMETHYFRDDDEDYER